MTLAVDPPSHRVELLESRHCLAHLTCGCSIVREERLCVGTAEPKCIYVFGSERAPGPANQFSQERPRLLVSKRRRRVAATAWGPVRHRRAAYQYAIDATPRAVILEEKDVFIKTLIQTPKGK